MFKNSLEFLPVKELNQVPAKVRGIYVLFKVDREKRMNVVYVGMARGTTAGAKARLISHRKKKPNLWSHFSVFEVWDNIPAREVEELEGLFRHLYRLDAKANQLNVQKSHKALTSIRRKSAEHWV